MRPHRIVLVLLAAMLAVPLLSIPAFAAPGDLDTTFSGDGKVVVDPTTGIDTPTAMALQPDGKVVVVGDAGGSMGALRLTSGGAVDNSFSGDGFQRITFGNDGSQANAVAIQPDGKIVLAGSVNPGSVGLVRLLATGMLDTSFGTGGTARFTFLSSSTAYGLVVLPDGKLVIAGIASSFNNDFLLARFNADGTIDPSFGTNGSVTVNSGDLNDFAYALARQSDGKLVIAGTSGFDTFTIARFTEGGAPDGTFGTGGFVDTEVGPDGSVAHALAIQPDGKLVAVGYACVSSATGCSFDDHGFAISRYLSNGNQDSTFSGDGEAVFELGEGGAEAHGVAIQPDGRIVLVGESIVTELRLTLLRLTTAGAKDTAFGGGDGVVTTDFVFGGEQGPAVLLQPDGKILALDEAQQKYAVVRYLGESTDATKPTSTISRPRNNLSYYQANLTGFTGTASDTGGSGVSKVQIAFRRYFTDGTCANWNGNVFVKGACNLRVWHDVVGTTSWSYTLPRVLTKSTPPSTVKNYLVMSRAIDVAGNTETLLTDGRNRNFFEVI